MPRYQYTARTRQGKIVSGAMDALGRDEAITRLQEQGLLVTLVVDKEPTMDGVKKSKKSSHKRIRLSDLILMARQLTTLLGAGLTLLKSLELISSQIESIRLNAIIRK